MGSGDSLITFTSKGGPPLKLEKGDPGTLLIMVWSGFAKDVSLESLSLTLLVTFNAYEGGKVVKSLDAPVQHPRKNSVVILIPPQWPGSYVLGVMSGYIGDVKLRSHMYYYPSAAGFKGGPLESDHYLSFEKPLCPILERFMKQRFIKERQRKDSTTKVIVATKFVALPWRFGCGTVVLVVRSSLKKLSVDSIDLYQLHWPGLWGNEEYIDGLADAIELGLVKAVGVLNYKESRLRDAYAQLKKRGVVLA